MVSTKVKKVPWRVLLRQRRYLVYTGVSAVVAAVLLLTVMIPRIEVLLGARDMMDSKTMEQEKLREKVDLLDGFNTQTFRTENSRINQILPSTKPFFQLLFSLQKLTAEQGVALNGLDMSPGSIASESANAKNDASSGTGMQSVSFNVSLLGNSQKIRDTIDKFSTLAPALDVESFTLEPKKTDGGDSLYEANIVVRALYMPLKVTAGKGSVPKKLTAEEEAYIQELRKFRLPPSSTAELGEVAPAPPSGKTNPFAN